MKNFILFNLGANKDIVINVNQIATAQLKDNKYLHLIMTNGTEYIGNINNNTQMFNYIFEQQLLK